MSGSGPDEVTRIGVLGALEVQRDDEPVEIRRGLPGRLLCSLVLSRGRAVPTDTLVEQLWGERLPANPSNALQIQMAYLRRVLGGSTVAPIVTRPEGYLLDPGRIDVDVDRFESRLARARQLGAATSSRDAEAAVGAYDDALAEWRGPTPYATVAGLGFADPEIVRLEELRLCAQEERCEVLLALGRTGEAVAELRAMVEAHPWRERRQELLVLALYRSGRQADALRAYTRARRTLSDDLGVDPGPALRALEQQILAHDPRLDWQPPTGASTGLDPGPDDRPSAPRPALIGRDDELARLSHLMTERRLVTLTGPGGAGKTRLAMEAAARWAGGQVHVVDLAPLDRTSDVMAAIVAGVGVPVAGDVDPAAALAAALGAQDCLLVLDTCEHVQPGLAPLLERVLDAAPDARVLATSRRPLGVTGELAWPLPPLAVPIGEDDPRRAAAFELFVQRAREVRSDFEVADGDVGVIAEVCRSLDGLPLAIELAAAQMDALSPRAVLDQLADHRSLAARLAGPDRHRTLGATTDWSIGLLDEPERDMLHRLAVFAPTFDVEAAVAVAGHGDPSAVARLVTLVRNSLVTQTAEDRYRLLDTVRSHLLSMDDPEGRLAVARNRHATYYADLVAEAFTRIRTPEQGVWLRRLADDHPNIRVALHHCFGPDGDEQLGARLAADIAWAWTLQGKWLESQAALERAGSVEAEPLVRARVLLGIGLLAAPLGDHDKVREMCLRSAQLGRSAGDDESVASAYLTLGVAQWASGDLEAAAATHDRAAALFDGGHHLWGATICRVLRARTARDTGDLDGAAALLDRALDDAKQTGDAHVIGLAYEQYARLWLARGETDRASMAAAASLAHNEQLGYPEGVSAALALSAQVSLAGGDPGTAREMQRRVLALCAGIGHAGGMCGAVEAIAEIDAGAGDRVGAAWLLLIAQRARARRNLPLASADDQRLAGLRSRLRAELGPAWDDLAGRVPLTSLSEAVQSLLDAE